MSFRLVDLANLQTSLARDILNDTASSTALHKALQPGHNEATASALSLIHVLISDQTEQRWSIKAKNAWNILSTDAKVGFFPILWHSLP